MVRVIKPPYTRTHARILVDVDETHNFVTYLHVLTKPGFECADFNPILFEQSRLVIHLWKESDNQGKVNKNSE